MKAIYFNYKFLKIKIKHVLQKAVKSGGVVKKLPTFLKKETC